MLIFALRLTYVSGFVQVTGIFFRNLFYYTKIYSPMANNNNAHQKRIKKVAAKLRDLRKEAGYSSYETFANDHDLPRVQYWRMENGTNFRFSTFLNVLDKHEMPLYEFFDGIE